MSRRIRSSGGREVAEERRFIASPVTASVLALLLATALAPAAAQAGTDQLSRPSGPFLEFSPSTNGTYDYGLVEVGQAASQLFTIANTGSKPTSSLSLTFSGSVTFAISEDACSGINLRPGGSCTFLLEYTPGGPETDSGTATVTGHRPSVTQGLYVIGTGFVLPPIRHLYWSTDAVIGRADVDGTNVEASFITGFSQAPFDLAVDADHIYWADSWSSTIGRANLDGTNVDQSFITGMPAFSPGGIAVDSDHIYWTESGLGTDPVTIGRASLDGTNVEHGFITLGSDTIVNDVKVDSSFVYWLGAKDSAHWIGRANLDGTNVDENFVDLGFGCPWSLAVDSSHIYWSDVCVPEGIHRADLDGSNVDDQFITLVDAPRGLKVDSSYIYWTEELLGTIGRAYLDGTGVDETFITHLGLPLGLAVDDG